MVHFVLWSLFIAHASSMKPAITATAAVRTHFFSFQKLMIDHYARHLHLYSLPFQIKSTPQMSEWTQKRLKRRRLVKLFPWKKKQKNYTNFYWKCILVSHSLNTDTNEIPSLAKPIPLWILANLSESKSCETVNTNVMDRSSTTARFIIQWSGYIHLHALKPTYVWDAVSHTFCGG